MYNPAGLRLVVGRAGAGHHPLALGRQRCGLCRRLDAGHRRRPADRLCRGRVDRHLLLWRRPPLGRPACPPISHDAQKAPGLSNRWHTFAQSTLEGGPSIPVIDGRQRFARIGQPQLRRRIDSQPDTPATSQTRRVARSLPRSSVGVKTQTCYNTACYANQTSTRKPRTFRCAASRVFPRNAGGSDRLHGQGGHRAHTNAPPKPI